MGSVTVIPPLSHRDPRLISRQDNFIPLRNCKNRKKISKNNALVINKILNSNFAFFSLIFFRCYFRVENPANFDHKNHKKTTDRKTGPEVTGSQINIENHLTHMHIYSNAYLTRTWFRADFTWVFHGCFFGQMDRHGFSTVKQTITTTLKWQPPKHAMLQVQPNKGGVVIWQSPKLIIS